MKIKRGRLVRVTSEGDHSLKLGTIGMVHSRHEIINETYIRIFSREIAANVPVSCVELIR